MAFPFPEAASQGFRLRGGKNFGEGFSEKIAERENAVPVQAAGDHAAVAEHGDMFPKCLTAVTVGKQPALWDPAT